MTTPPIPVTRDGLIDRFIAWCVSHNLKASHPSSITSFFAATGPFVEVDGRRVITINI